MKQQPVSIEQMKNIGPTIARRLNAVGIRTSDNLRAVGSIVAYRRICERHPGKTIPVCYYLYSLEGALRNRHRDAIGPKIKERLLCEARPSK